MNLNNAHQDREAAKLPHAARHWDDAAMLERIYLAESASTDAEAHLAACGACAARWAELVARRSEFVARLAESEVSPEALQRQRQAIWSRIERPAKSGVRQWAPAGAMALMLGLGILLSRPVQLPPDLPAHVVKAPVQDVSDDQLFKELAVLSSPEQLRAAEPVRGLFEASESEPEEVF